MSSVIVMRVIVRSATLVAMGMVSLSSAQAEECQWLFSPGGRANFVKLATGASLGLLRFGDFDGDGKTDVFFNETIPGAPAGSSKVQWRFAPGGNLPFKDLGQGPAFGHFAIGGGTVGLGDFNGDRRTDVFVIEEESLGVNRMKFSPNASGIFQDLATMSDSLALDADNPGFGDFDGDGKTDVFGWVRGDSPVQYVFSSGGIKEFQNLAKDRLPVAFGDFNGDGKSDAFRIGQVVGNGAQWFHYSGGTGEPQNLAVGPRTRPGFGDFNGDGKTDVFSTADLGNGTHQWMFSSGGAENFENLAVGPPLFHNGQMNLGFGDFDGDRRTDVFTSSCP